MAVTVKLDIVGSDETEGISTNRNDRAVRLGVVTGITNDRAGVQQAIDAVLADPTVSSFTHHNLTTLPLASVSAVRFGPDKIHMRLEYARRYQSVPTQPAAVIARFLTGSRSVTWYHTRGSWGPTGLPEGAVNYHVVYNQTNGAEVGRIPSDWQWSQPTQRIIVPTYLSFNPFSVVGGLVGTINASSVAWIAAGFSAPAKWLRFDGMDVTWVDTNQGNRFDVRYNFTYARGGWFEEAAHFSDASQSWNFTVDDAEQAVSWGAGFPVHA